MLLLLRSTMSKAVPVDDDGGGGKTTQVEKEKEIQTTSLTVWRKSLVFSCNGFTVIDSDGNLVYRVDNYIGSSRRNELILMDGSGKTILTLRRKKQLRLLVENWLVYEGEVEDGHCRCNNTGSKKLLPAFCVRKHVNLLNTCPNVLARVFRGPTEKRFAYVIEGSYAQRCCRVLDQSGKMVAEIKRKEAMNGGVSFGVEVFSLIVRSGFDPAFAMALVLLLDQMFA